MRDRLCDVTIDAEILLKILLALKNQRWKNMNHLKFRDFLTGRDQDIKKIESKLPDKSDEEKYQLTCDTIIRDYKNDCRKYQNHMSGLMQMSITSSLTSFTRAVVKFTQEINNSLSQSQAQTILKASRFLRLCVAGRTVYSQNCVKLRDIGHIEAENLLTRALTALNNRRHDAIQIASRHDAKKSKKTRSKKSGGKKSPTKNAANNNLYGLLSDALDDVTKTMDGLEVDDTVDEQAVDEQAGEEEEGKEEVTETQDLAPGDFMEAFLEQEVNIMKDTVNYILAADHISDISDTIWQGNNDRQTVHLRSYAYIGLPTKSVHEFLHKFDKNRMLFHLLGIHLRGLYDKGFITEQQVKETFEVVTQFIKEIRNETTLEVFTTCSHVLWQPDYPDKVPTKRSLQYKLRLLSVASRTNPLFISYVSHFPRIMVSFFTSASQRNNTIQQAMKFSASVADAFVTNFHKHPSVKEMILEGVNYDAQTFINNTTLTLGDTPVKNSESRVPDYPPIFVFFRDYRYNNTRTPVLLPVKLLENDDTVILQIYHQSVDDYVTDLIKANLANPEIGQETLEVFIPSSHIAYFPGGNESSEKIQTLGKSVVSVTHVDNTAQTLLPTSVEPETS